MAVDITFSTDAEKVKKDIDQMRRSIKLASIDVDKTTKATNKLAKEQLKLGKTTKASTTALKGNSKSAAALAAIEKRLAQGVGAASVGIKAQNALLAKNVVAQNAAATAATRRAALSGGLGAGGAALGGPGGGALGKIGSTAGVFGMAAAPILAGAAVISAALLTLGGEIRQIDTVVRGAAAFREEIKQRGEARSSAAAGSARSILGVRRSLHFLGTGGIERQEADPTNKRSLTALSGGTVPESLAAIESITKRFGSGTQFETALKSMKLMLQTGADMSRAVSFAQQNLRGDISARDLAASELSSRSGGHTSFSLAGGQVDRLNANPQAQRFNEQAELQSRPGRITAEAGLQGVGTASMQKAVDDLGDVLTKIEEANQREIAIITERHELSGGVVQLWDQVKRSFKQGPLAERQDRIDLGDRIINERKGNQ